MAAGDELMLSRRRALAALGLTGAALTACSSGDPGPGGYGSGAQAPAEAREGSLEAPQITAAEVTIAGSAIQPVTGLQIGVINGASALTPESLGEGRAQITYVWNDPQDWGYLAVEGPASFAVPDESAAEQAALAEEQRLVAALIRPSEPTVLPWDGFAQCVQMTWNQSTVPPGWEAEASVDAIGLFLVDGAGRSYTLIAYGPRDRLGANNPAFYSLCSAAPAA